MNKSELVSAVAEKTSMTKIQAQSAIEAILEVITAQLKIGSDVRILGFGNFSVTKRAATTSRNPRTGEEIKVPPSNRPKFSAGKGLKEALNTK